MKWLDCGSSVQQRSYPVHTAPPRNPEGLQEEVSWCLGPCEGDDHTVFNPLSKYFLHTFNVEMCAVLEGTWKKTKGKTLLLETARSVLRRMTWRMGSVKTHEPWQDPGWVCSESDKDAGWGGYRGLQRCTAPSQSPRTQINAEKLSKGD